jgi:hypothetical protein
MNHLKVFRKEYILYHEISPQNKYTLKILLLDTGIQSEFSIFSSGT